MHIRFVCSFFFFFLENIIVATCGTGLVQCQLSIGRSSWKLALPCRNACAAGCTIRRCSGLYYSRAGRDWWRWGWWWATRCSTTLSRHTGAGSTVHTHTHFGIALSSTPPCPCRSRCWTSCRSRMLRLLREWTYLQSIVEKESCFTKFTLHLN